MKALFLVPVCIASVLMCSALITIALFGLPTIIFESLNGYSYGIEGDGYSFGFEDETVIGVFFGVSLFWGIPKFFEVYNDFMEKNES